MKKFTLPLSFCPGLLALFIIGCNQKGPKNQDSEGLSNSQVASENTDTQKRVLRHVVLFKFKDSSTPKDIKAIEDTFSKLPDRIDEILDFEWGTDVSVENLSQGFTHCFLVTFQTEKDREIYLPHPAHKEFVDLCTPHIDKVLVVDYFSKE